MITDFKIFEKLKIGYKFNEGINGSIIVNEKIKYLSNIIKFLKDKNIEYETYYNPSKFMVILFTNLQIETSIELPNGKKMIGSDWNKKEKKKFPKDKWNENKPYLPVIDNDGDEIDAFEIRLLYQDHIEDSTKIDNLDDLEQIIATHKYNI